MPAEKILVTGATGKVGRELVPLLLKSGAEVRAGTRSPERARALFGSDVEILELSYGWTDTYDATLTWSDRVFLVPPPFSPEGYDDMVPFMDWAVAARVRHIVLLSGMTVGEVEELALRKVELHLEAQDTDHTILRPNLYMQNFHPGFLSQAIRDEDRFRLPAGEGKVSLVDVRDVAEVAARTLTTKEHYERTYTLTGAKALSLSEAARVISEAVGREISYESVSDAEFRALLEEEGRRPGEVEVILGLFGAIRDGGRATVHPDLPGTLGRPPRTFEDFVQEAAESWG